jgi:hypothetical protein
MISLETKQYEENIQIQTMYNEGFDTTLNYMMIISFHILHNSLYYIIHNQSFYALQY